MSKGPWKKHQIQEAMASAGFNSLYKGPLWQKIDTYMDYQSHKLTTSYSERTYDFSEELKVEAMNALAMYAANGGTTGLGGYERIVSNAMNRRYRRDLEERKAAEETEDYIIEQTTINRAVELPAKPKSFNRHGESEGETK